MSIGSLLTFELTGRLSITPGELRARPPTPSTNAEVAVPVANDGSEPTIVRAAAAIIASNGTLIGKLALDPRRLLPGEQTVLSADYPGELASGSYRIVATVESAKRAWTRTAELVVP